jgi:bacteriorhodopsin
MAIKILNALLILMAFYMGVKQGWAMVSGKAEMADMFAKWNISKNGLLIIGLFTIVGALMVLIPQTFVWGNFITAAVILLIICLHLNETTASVADRLKGMAFEMPFLLLSLVIIYLQHPLAKSLS